MSEWTVNQSLKNLQPSAIRAFNDQIAGIEGLIPLTLGEPDFDTPDFIKQAAIQAINQAHNGYTHSKGMLPLRQAIHSYLARKYQVTYDPNEEIIVTAGATEALFASLMGLLNPGDEVLVPAPHYAVYGTQVGLCGGKMVPIDVSEEDFIFRPDRLAEAIEAHPKARLLLFNHPNNPTGRSYQAEQLSQLAQVIKRHSLMVLSDEIYSELTYDFPHTSLAHYLPDQTILINGASKSHAMTGWRMGFICGPREIISEIFKVHQATVNTPTTQAQYAALAAYQQGDEAIIKMRQAYQVRRDFLLDAFTDLGYDLTPPQGAFYLFVQVPTWFDGDETAFCLALANQAKVGVIPGSAFGQAGSGYFRLSYAASLDQLQEAMQRIAHFTMQYRG